MWIACVWNGVAALQTHITVHTRKPALRSVQTHHI